MKNCKILKIIQYFFTSSGHSSCVQGGNVSIAKEKRLNISTVMVSSRNHHS